MCCQVLREREVTPTFVGLEQEPKLRGDPHSSLSYFPSLASSILHLVGVFPRCLGGGVAGGHHVPHLEVVPGGGGLWPSTPEAFTNLHSLCSGAARQLLSGAPSPLFPLMASSSRGVARESTYRSLSGTTPGHTAFSLRGADAVPPSENRSSHSLIILFTPSFPQQTISSLSAGNTSY